MWTSRSATCPHAHTALRPPPIVAVGFHTKRRGANVTKGETFSFEVTAGMFDYMEKEFQRPTDSELSKSIIQAT